MTTSDSRSWWEQLQRRMEEQMDEKTWKALYECSPPFEQPLQSSTRSYVDSQELTIEVLRKAHSLPKGMTWLTIYVSDYAPDTEVFYELTILEGWDLFGSSSRPVLSSKERTLVGSRKAFAALLEAWGVTVQPGRPPMLPVGVKVIMPSEEKPHDPEEPNS
jgi:hypothetical protein